MKRFAARAASFCAPLREFTDAARGLHGKLLATGEVPVGMSVGRYVDAPRAGVCVAAIVAMLGIAPQVARAEAPPNDAQAAAIPLDASKASVAGATDAATSEKTDPAGPCGESVSGTLWYRLGDIPRRDVILRLIAGGKLDAVVAVYHVRGDRLIAEECGQTGDDGVVTISFPAVAGDYVLVGQLASSPPGPFQLRALVPAPDERVPGRPLHGAARATVERYVDEADLWHVRLRAGESYRISLVTRREACPSVRLYRPGGPPAESREVFGLRCNGATSFTPGPDGGGRYLLRVSASYEEGLQPYRLQVGRAQIDDTAPGLKLRVGIWQGGRLAPSSLDQMDMYRFDLEHKTDVLLALGRPRPRTVSLLLVQENGKRVAAGQAIRRSLTKGTYFVVVSAPTGTRGVPYRLFLRERGVSHLSVERSRHVVVPIGSEVQLAAQIGAPAGRTATLQIDRFDPLEGWLFLRRYSLPVARDATTSLTWKPANVGQYRARITVPSRSAYLYISVTEPPPAGTEPTATTTARG